LLRHDGPDVAIMRLLPGSGYDEKRTVRLEGIQPAIDNGGTMATSKQRTAARRNIKKAAAAAKRKRTIVHLPKRTRTALGKQAAKTARRKRRAA
jgi:hypothetical protein